MRAGAGSGSATRPAGQPGSRSRGDSRSIATHTHIISFVSTVRLSDRQHKLADVRWLARELTLAASLPPANAHTLRLGPGIIISTCQDHVHAHYSYYWPARARLQPVLGKLIPCARLRPHPALS